VQTEVDPEPAAFGGTLDPCIHNAPVPGVALLAARRRYISRATVEQANRSTTSKMLAVIGDPGETRIGAASQQDQLELVCSNHVCKLGDGRFGDRASEASDGKDLLPAHMCLIRSRVLAGGERSPIDNAPTPGGMRHPVPDLTPVDAYLTP